MRDLIKPAVILFLICLIVAGALGVTFAVTKDAITQRGILDAEASRMEVFSSADDFKTFDWKNFYWSSKEKDFVKAVYVAYKGETELGYVFDVFKKGYGGEMKLTIGIDLNQKVTGVKIGENNETPGLGSKASNKPFLSQLVNLKPEQKLEVIKLKKTKPEEIEAISGATITSKAVTKGVQVAIDAAKALLEKGDDVE